MSPAEIAEVEAFAKVYQGQLYALSWFMRILWTKNTQGWMHVPNAGMANGQRCPSVDCSTAKASAKIAKI